MSKPKVHAKMERATVFDKLKESDRGCVILMAAILEEDLGRLHHANVNFLVAKKEIADITKIVFEGRLSTFNDKISAARKYDLISDEERKALDHIRDLRNDAAHFEYKFSFEDEGVKKLLNKLREVVNPERTNTERAGRKRDFVALASQLDEALKSKYTELVQQINIVLPENWTGGLDGESEETIIPSGTIDETTT
jgi:hypothetical protein